MSGVWRVEIRKRAVTLGGVTRWLRSDLDDVVRVVPRRGADGPRRAIPLSAGLGGWERRFLRARTGVLLRRQLLLALGIAAALELLGTLTGASDRILWLAVPAAVALLGALLGLHRAPTPEHAALLLDRQLGLAERLTTALELGDSAREDQSPFGALVLAEADAAVGRSLATSRASAPSAHREWLAILAGAAVVAGLLAIPAGAQSPAARRASSSTRVHAHPREFSA